MEWFILGVIVGVVAALYFGNGSQHSEELENLKQEIAGWRQKYYNLEHRLAEKERELTVLSGDYRARQQRLLGSIGTAASQIDQVLALFPQVEDVRSYLNRLDPADVGKLDLPFAHELQTHMTQAYADNLEAMGNLYHGLLKLASGLHYLKATGAATTPGVRFTGDVFEELIGTLIEYAHKIDMPGIREEFAEVIAIHVRRVKQAVLNGEEAPDPKLTAKILQALDEAKIRLPEAGRSPLPTNVVVIPASPDLMPAGPHHNGHSAKADRDEEDIENEHI